MLENLAASHPTIDTDDRFQLLVDSIEDYALYMLDAEGHVVTWNKGAQRNKGYTADEIVGQHFSRFFLEADRIAGLPETILATALAEGRFSGEGWRQRKDETRFWASVTLTAARSKSGEFLGFVKVTRDLTERKLHEEALLASERALQQERDRLHVTLYSIADGVISTDGQGLVTLMNPVAEAMTGWSRTEAVGRPIEQVFQMWLTETGANVRNPIRDCLEHNRPFYLQDGVSLKAKNGSLRDVQDSAAPIRSPDGFVSGAVLVFQDVTRLRSIQREIAFSATHDSLTQLPNRTQLERALEEALLRVRTQQRPQTLCFLDLDRFKVVNDTAGHAAGDVLLKTIATLLTKSVRGADLVARLGGDEFAILLTSCTAEQAQGTLEKILTAISGLHFIWEGRSFTVSVSIGVTEIMDDFDTTMAMKQADVACYASKNAGRNRISVYHPDNQEVYARHQQLQVAAEMRDAIADDRFLLLAQPIVALSATPETHYELLLRMQNRDGEAVLPGAFIPAAERYDLMAAIDRWVLKSVLGKHARQIMQQPHLHFSVNLSANSLNDAEFLPFFLPLLNNSPLDPRRLTFEITETSLINNMINASSVIEKLRSAGCKVALDDFGIGMSSFSYLRSFSVDYIKIEGTFVRNVPHSAVDMTIVKSINNIAHEIGAQTVAEFVESEEILTHMRNLGVDYAQGFHLGRPRHIEEVFKGLNRSLTNASTDRLVNGIF